MDTGIASQCTNTTDERSVIQPASPSPSVPSNSFNTSNSHSKEASHDVSSRVGERGGDVDDDVRRGGAASLIIMIGSTRS